MNMLRTPAKTPFLLYEGYKKRYLRCCSVGFMRSYPVLRAAH